MDTDQTISGLFNKNEPEKLNKFLHECIDQICGCKGPLYQKYCNSSWTKEEFNDFYIQILKLLHNPNSLYCDIEKMSLEFHELPKHIQDAMMTCLKVRKSELTDALLYHYSSKHKPTLLNYDWSLKYVMGSSTMVSIREPLLQLNLICKDKKEENIIKLELDESELNMLIETLETVANPLRTM
ncbi:COMM domain-containing protein 8-like [Phymastichus coffea]|uniref:COMM domain-containing protein 8-like n=1 Tax=Phymastichus coffea TaxID=108790 RepID=UPI00273BC5E1|nr:COMM domain-containing protein 8-like [Phymastichus coffea]XP_058790980.1 COMM domain-containing protein 8-like [Phymastichus coffea]XP_058790981.1 COMM domain-containing protein 8-like [Phymastichus coffea]